MMNSLHLEHASAAASYRLAETRIERRPRREPGAPSALGRAVEGLLARFRRSAQAAVAEVAELAEAAELAEVTEAERAA